ncbi:MAG: hypothetical protein ABUT20_39535 [Bacteroidota bacterium]
MKNKKKAILVITLFLAAVSLYIYKEYNRKNKDLGSVTPDVKIQTGSLIKKFETDEESANKAFLTKKDFVVAVTGPVKEVTKDEKGYYTIVMGDTTSMSSVRCAIDSVHQQDAATVKPGEPVTIQGAITGFNKDELLGSDVILNRCAIVQKNK